jgi:hypothetical protein
MTWHRSEAARPTRHPDPLRRWEGKVAVVLFVLAAIAGAALLFVVCTGNAYSAPPWCEHEEQAETYRIEPDAWERLLIERALQCPNGRRRYKDPWLLLDVLRYEARPDVRVPARWRGMTLAAACNESGYHHGPKGDEGKSWGFTQLRRVHHKRCGLSAAQAMDPRANAQCWLLRIRATYDWKPTRKMCPSPEPRWRLAWMWIAKGNIAISPHRRCKRNWNKGHMGRLQKWRREMWDPLTLPPHRGEFGSDEP